MTEKGVTRRGVLEAFAVIAAAAALPNAAFAGKAGIPKATPERIEAFKAKMPANLRPFIDMHMRTQTGREDIDILVHRVSGIETAKPGYFMHLRFGKEEKASHDQLAFGAALDKLDINDRLDVASFSVLLSNEAAHSFQHEAGLWTDQFKYAHENFILGMRRYFEIEMASDARSYLHMGQMLQQGLVTIEDVPFILKNEKVGELFAVEDFVSAYNSTGSVEFSALKGVEHMWDTENGDFSRIGQYIENSVYQAALGKNAYYQLAEETGFDPKDRPRSTAEWRKVLDQTTGVAGLQKVADHLARGLVNKMMDIPQVSELLKAMSKGPLTPERLVKLGVPTTP